MLLAVLVSGEKMCDLLPPLYSGDTNNSSHLLVITTDTRHHRHLQGRLPESLGGVHERTVACGERHFPDRCTLVKINIYSQLLLKAPRHAQFTLINGFRTTICVSGPSVNWTQKMKEDLHLTTLKVSLNWHFYTSACMEVTELIKSRKLRSRMGFWDQHRPHLTSKAEKKHPCMQFTVSNKCHKQRWKANRTRGNK